MTKNDNSTKLKIYKTAGDVHASNILTKYNCATLNENQKKIIEIHVPNYITYRDNFKKANSLKKRVELYNLFQKKSYRLNRNKNDKEIFSFQSKFLSTIMEEFFKLILTPIAESYNLFCGSIKAYNQLTIENSITGEPNLIISEKNQDLAIYKNIDLKINEKVHTISLPILSIECKTWLDKTMLEGSASTAFRIKQGVSNAKFFIVTETYGVGKKVRKLKDIDKIFITKQRLNDADSYMYDSSFSVIKLIFDEVQKHIALINNQLETLIDDSVKLGVIH